MSHSWVTELTSVAVGCSSIVTVGWCDLLLEEKQVDGVEDKKNSIL